ncbi:MAG: phosphatidylserine decarboxylase [Candidatus Dadabacteria bacterium]|nr:MAG: phosphatidylserine decarboxylase [Candidatus Dadabacteria bacterium]
MSRLSPQAQVVFVIARFVTHALSRIGGFVAAIPVPRPVREPLWTWIARLLGADLSEAALPAAQFRTFQELFTRELSPGLRPIAQGADVWVSPVDASWLSHERVSDDVFIPVKGNRHRLSALIGLAGASGQDMLVSTFYLRPYDYHRIHAPADLVVDRVFDVPGTLFPVNRAGQRVPGLFVRNARVVLEGRWQQQRVWIVCVGALMVGSVALSHPGLEALRARRTTQAVTITKGQELGMFRFGSTVIIVTDHFCGDVHHEPREVRVGQEIFRCGAS